MRHLEAKRWLPVMAAGLLLAGCATEAQQRADQMQAALMAADQQGSTCVTAAYGMTNSARAAAHIAADPAQPTPQQLADAAFPAISDVKSIYFLHDEVQLCRRSISVAYKKIAPSIDTLMLQSWQKADQMVRLLVQRKITWGAFNGNQRQLMVDYRKAAQTEIQRLSKDPLSTIEPGKLGI